MSLIPPVGRSIDAVRRQNLSSVVTVLHRDGATTRSEITRATGLARSSVASLVEELESAGIVAQRFDDHRGAKGRPSASVAATDRYLGVGVNTDVDGVHVALISLDGRVVDEAHAASSGVPTPEEAAAFVGELVERLRQRHRDVVLVGLCAAIPGRVTKDKSVVLNAPHLRWRNAPFARLLQDATDLPAVLAFDSQVGLHAETLWGAARGADDIVSFYGGPGGIGAAAMVDGRILDGRSGAAARLGHVTVANDGPTCICGSVGCLTTVVSQHQLASVFGARDGSLPRIRDAIHADSSAAFDRFLLRQADYLGVALRAATFAYDPQLILLGGFFGVLLDHGREHLERAVSANLMSSVEPPTLAAPALGAQQLVIGAGAVAFDGFISDPMRQERVGATL